LDAEAAINVAPPRQEALPSPPSLPPPPEQEGIGAIFIIVEDKPAFPGCENVVNKKEREICADTKLLQYLYGNIKYPTIARENGVEGTVVIRFVVEKDGSISAAQIVRDIGAGCGQEALRVVNTMPKWNPGKQLGRPVRVQFNLPVKFKLE
ncbi:MAG: energy transducer TonB, partial [Bacteroidota bacterium]